MAAATDRAQMRRLIDDELAATGLEAEVVAPDVWATTLAGERKRTLPVVLRLDDRSLHVSALLCGAPDEGHAEVYRYLLTRNQKPLPVHFALSDEGDVVLTGLVPVAALGPGAVDGLLGAVLGAADEVFNAVLRLGFGTYIRHEQRWRAANQLPPNPISARPPT